MKPSSSQTMSGFSQQYRRDYFDGRHVGEDPRREITYRQEYQRILQYVQQGTVLDVGCGMGDFLDLFEERRWQKYGIEISDYACEVAQRKGIHLIDYEFDGESFDLIVFRGVFQHLDQPLYTIQKCINMLKPGGYMVFLATPNTDSICYRLFRDLPMLDPKRNFVLPSDRMLRQILSNFGLEVKRFNYPYLQSVYSSPIRDHYRFLFRLFGVKSKFAFWRNMMECYAQKP